MSEGWFGTWRPPLQFRLQFTRSGAAVPLSLLQAVHGNGLIPAPVRSPLQFQLKFTRSEDAVPLSLLQQVHGNGMGSAPVASATSSGKEPAVEQGAPAAGVGGEMGRRNRTRPNRYLPCSPASEATLDVELDADAMKVFALWTARLSEWSAVNAYSKLDSWTQRQTDLHCVRVMEEVPGLPRGHRGLMTVRNVVAGQAVAILCDTSVEYHGPLIGPNVPQYLQLENGRRVLYDLSRQAWKGSLANGGYGTLTGQDNCKFTVVTCKCLDETAGVVFVVATKHIGPGTQLVVTYTHTCVNEPFT